MTFHCLGLILKYVVKKYNISSRNAELTDSCIYFTTRVEFASAIFNQRGDDPQHTLHMVNELLTDEVGAGAENVPPIHNLQ